MVDRYRIDLRIPDDWIDHLTDAAFMEGLSVNAWVRLAIIDRLAKIGVNVKQQESNNG